MNKPSDKNLNVSVKFMLYEQTCSFVIRNKFQGKEISQHERVSRNYLNINTFDISLCKGIHNVINNFSNNFRGLFLKFSLRFYK